MSNLKNNKGSFALLLFGLIFTGLITFHLFKTAFSKDYPQIAPIIIGSFFGIFSLIIIFCLTWFFKKDENWDMKLNFKTNKKNWSFLKYAPAFFALISFWLAIRFYNNIENQKPIEYQKILVVQTNESHIGSVKSSKYINIETKEYPKFKFSIGSLALRRMDSNYYLNVIKPGDTLTLVIWKESYDKKIIKTAPLTLTDKTVNYDIIGVYGVEHKGIEILSTTDSEIEDNENSTLGVFIFIGLGLFLLYLQFKKRNEKASR